MQLDVLTPIVCSCRSRQGSQVNVVQRVGPKQNLNIKGWNSHVYRKVPGNHGSRNLSRDNLSREIGCKHDIAMLRLMCVFCINRV